MRKLIFLFLLLPLFGFGQKMLVDVIRYDTITSTQRDAYTVPDDEVWFIYNETTGQFEYNVKNGGWNVFGGLASSNLDTSAKIAAIVGDETGTGALVFGTSPTLTTPALGTPSALNLTNATALPEAQVTAHEAALSITESQISDLGTYIPTSDIIDEDDMTSDDATKVPSQQSVKAYVDTEISGIGALSDGDKGDITVSSSGTVWSIDSGAVGSTEITDGDIDESDLDTSVNASLDLADSALQSSDIIDEDDMTSDDATKVPTQQSVKAYVDANSGGDVSAASNFGTDNVLIRSDGTTKGVQSSGITIDDSDNITMAGYLDMDGQDIDSIVTMEVTTINERKFQMGNPLREIRHTWPGSAYWALAPYYGGVASDSQIQLDLSSGEWFISGDLDLIGTTQWRNATNSNLIDAEFINSFADFSLSPSGSGKQLTYNFAADEWRYDGTELGTGVGTDDQDASEVAFTPYSTIASTDVQAAIEELKDEVDAVGGLSDGDKGDITVSSSGTVWSIDSGVVGTSEVTDGSLTGSDMTNNTIPLNKLSQLSIDGFLGNDSGGTSNISTLTVTEARTLLNVEDAAAADQDLSLSGTGDKDLTIEDGNTIDLTDVDGIDPDNIVSKGTGRTSAVQYTDIYGQTLADYTTDGAPSGGELVVLTDASMYIEVALSDYTTDLTTGTSKAYWRAPYAMTVTDVRASVLTAPTGSTIIVDINENGTTIMSTNKLSIDASEKTSTTAATAAGVTDTSIADDAEITFDIDQIGSTIAGQGLLVKIYYR